MGVGKGSTNLSMQGILRHTFVQVFAELHNKFPGKRCIDDQNNAIAQHIRPLILGVDCQ